MTDRTEKSPSWWDQLSTCFEGASALPSAERAAFVASCFPNDRDARRQVLEMLAESVGGRAMAIEQRLLAHDIESETLAAGTALGAYRVVGLLGRGGMGEVYRADRVEGGYEQLVAIKILKAGTHSRELVRRFESERRILARLTHPNIVAILDGGTTGDGRPYLVMPLVEGASILEHCATKALSLDARLRLFIGVADAVQYAHARLVVHRDIKPSNILVTEDGDVRLLDFGIAKLLLPADSTGDPAALALTRSELRLLTPEHAAPEQVRGEPITVATDVYALGVLLYQLLTGTRPHVAAGRSLAELERDILAATPAAPSVAGRDTSWKRRLRGDLDRITLMALRKEPDRRYASAGQFGEDVDRCLKGLPVRAERDSVAYRARKFVRRNRVGVTSAVLVFSSLVLFLANSMRQTRVVERERDIARRERASTQSVVALLTSFFAQSNPMIVPGGDTLRVQQLLSFAEASIDSLTREPAVQARMWSVLGEMHAARGRPDLAVSLLQRSYDRMLSANGSDSLDVARTHLSLARAVDLYEGQRKSLPMFEVSLARFRRVLGDSASEVTTVRRELAVRTNDLEKQRRVLEEIGSADGLAKVADPIERAERLHALAIQRLNDGALTDATAMFEEALRLVDLKLPQDHPNRMIVAGTVATARQQSGDFERAFIMAQTFLDDAASQHSVNPLALAAARERLAALQAERGFLEEAERLERMALAGWRASLVATHPNVWYGLQNMAMISAVRGREREAIAYIDSSIALAKAGAASEADLLQLLDLRGELFMHVNRWRDASITLRALSPRIEATWPAAHQVQNRHRWRLGVLALAEGKDSLALQHFDEAIQKTAPMVPTTFPLLVASQCGRAIAAQRSASRTVVDSSPRNSCDRYRRYGLHIAQLVQWSVQAPALAPRE